MYPPTLAAVERVGYNLATIHQYIDNSYLYIDIWTYRYPAPRPQHIDHFGIPRDQDTKVSRYHDTKTPRYQCTMAVWHQNVCFSRARGPTASYPHLSGVGMRSKNRQFCNHGTKTSRYHANLIAALRIPCSMPQKIINLRAGGHQVS